MADARINNAGFAFDTLGGALRDVDKRVDIAIEEAGAIDFALSHGGEVTLDTGEWVYGSLNPDTGGVEEASRQVIHTKDYLKLPPSTRFSLGADFRLECVGCGHQVMIPRVKAEKNIREIIRNTCKD